MKTKTQLITNTLLTPLIAFIVYISLDTQKKMQVLSSQMDSIELRDRTYFEKRMKILEDIEKQIESEEQLY